MINNFLVGYCQNEAMCGSSCWTIYFLINKSITQGTFTNKLNNKGKDIQRIKNDRSISVSCCFSKIIISHNYVIEFTEEITLSNNGGVG